MSLNNPLWNPIDALRRDVAHTFVEMGKRIEAVETQLAALAPMQDSDRMEIARFCQATGIAIKDLDRRDASDHRARKVNRIFHALRQKGWSFDRIAKATGYSTRGVASNLERFTQSAFQETGRADSQKSQIGQTGQIPQNSPSPSPISHEKQ
jgi:hypothetical protein